MEKHFKVNDIAIIKTNAKNYQKDDVILLKDDSGLRLERIIEVIDNGGSKAYNTKSDNSMYIDHYELEEKMIVGRSHKKISNLSWFLKAARSPKTTLLIISILLIILFFLIQIRIYNPTRTRTGKKEESLFTILKTIFSKEYRESKRRKEKHSRYVQREKTQRDFRKKSKKRNRSKKSKIIEKVKARDKFIVSIQENNQSIDREENLMKDNIQKGKNKSKNKNYNKNYNDELAKKRVLKNRIKERKKRK